MTAWIDFGAAFSSHAKASVREMVNGIPRRNWRGAAGNGNGFAPEIVCLEPESARSSIFFIVEADAFWLVSSCP